ncbi:MAG: ABC transporter substrate-binding protein [Christensenellaceae bacterium]|jgi:NitT/TauT family transport system substrate-binding protein|nr:ABC transporter substrate-binding protein [Christensenellaceae bacterium]
MKHFTWRRALPLLLALFLLPGLLGCSGQSGLKTVRLSEVTHSVFYAAQYIAIENGYFAEEGLQIELTNAGGADKAMTALLSKTADIALMGPEASVYVYNEGREDYARVVGQLTACDGAFIIGREPMEGFTLEALRGKSIIGGRAGGMPLMDLEYALRKAGLEPGEDLTVLDHVQFNLMAGAFAGGEGDFTTLFEPTATEFENAGSGYVLGSVGALAGPMPATCYQVTGDTLKKDAATVEKFLRALYKGQKFVAEEDAVTVAKALAKQFPDTDLAVLTRVVGRYREIGAFAASPVLEQEPYDRLLDAIEQAGELKARPPYEKLVDNSLAKKALS